MNNRSHNFNSPSLYFRPLNKSEKDQRSWAVLDTPTNREVHVREKANQSKNFNFDRVFGPQSTQDEVYKTVVGRLINEVMQGNYFDQSIALIFPLKQIST